MTDTINPLGTQRYSWFEPWMGVPIQITVGAPRWMPGIDYITALKPLGLMKIVSDEEFTQKYLERLDRMADQIHADLLRLSAKYPGQRLVMMCYEDVTIPGGEMCHRTVAAEWLRAKGLEVPELPRSRDDAVELGLVEPAPNERRRPSTPEPEDLPPALF